MLYLLYVAFKVYVCVCLLRSQNYIKKKPRKFQNWVRTRCAVLDPLLLKEYEVMVYNDKIVKRFPLMKELTIPCMFRTLVSMCLKEFRHISHLCYTYIKEPLDQLTNKQLTTSYLDASRFRSPDIRHYHVRSRVLQMNSHINSRILTSFSDNPRIFMR